MYIDVIILKSIIIVLDLEHYIFHDTIYVSPSIGNGCIVNKK